MRPDPAYVAQMTDRCPLTPAFFPEYRGEGCQSSAAKCPEASLIIGGGNCRALHRYSVLAAAGFDVTIVDRASEDHEGCSFGNAGMIVPSHIVPLAAPGMIRMALKMMLRPRGPFFIRPRLDWDFWDWSWRFYRAATAEQ